VLADSDIISIPGFAQPFSSLSHLAGAGVFAVLGFCLLRRSRGDAARFAFVSVYIFSCILALSMSGVYHLLAFGGAGRAVLGRLDQGAIFVFIAATFTPVHGIIFHGWERWGPLLFIWVAAITAVTLKTIFFAGFPEWLGLILYLTMAWTGVASYLVLRQRYGAGYVRPLLLGGVAYTAGAVMDFVRWPGVVFGVFGSHEVFHIAVLLGMALHWQFISQFVTGVMPPRISSGFVSCVDVA